MFQGVFLVHDEGYDFDSSIHNEDHGGCSTKWKYLHCWRQTLPLRRSVGDTGVAVPVVFSIFVLLRHCDFDVPFGMPGRACQGVSVVMLLNAPAQGSTTIFGDTRTAL